MTINKNVEGTKLTVAIEGRLDTITSVDLEAEFKESLDGTTDLVIDMEKLEYISSAGLRVLLSAQKKMAKQGSLVIKNMGDTVKDVFQVTGFIDIFTVE